MRHKLFCTIGIVTLVFAFDAFAQSVPRQDRAARMPSFDGVVPSMGVVKGMPHDPLSALVEIGGTVPIGLDDKYHGGSLRGGLHNIAVDPSDPNKIHAAVMFAKNVTEADTVGSGSETFQQLRIYYMYSADGGGTWSAPKAIVNARSLFPELILYKRGTEYVPVIAAYRNVIAPEDSFVCAIYIETGSPGTGSFKEVRASRTTYSGEAKNIIWPSIAASGDGSKIYMVAGVSRPNTDDPFDYVQFGVFTLNEDRDDATFGGWQAGPQDGPAGSLISVRVAESGKIGVAWRNQDFNSPDLSLYLSESTDGGQTWSGTPTAMMTEAGTTNEDANGDFYYLVPVYFDFWYTGDSARAAIGAFYYNRNPTEGFYFPASGSLLFWKEGMLQAQLLISKLEDSDLGASLLDGSWLAEWNTGLGIDPQGRPNLTHPTVARTTDPNVFSIYFMVYQDFNTQDVGTIGESNFYQYFYSSIYRISTIDGGATFSAPVAIHANNPDNFEEPKYDYRHIETSVWNPGLPGGMNIHTLFAADSTAGECGYDELPGFGTVSWLFEKALFSDVRTGGEQGVSHVVNYPNPFGTRTELAFSLSAPAAVSLKVFDVLGRVAASEEFGTYEAGSHSVAFSSAALPAGSYNYVLRIGETSVGGVMTKLK